MRRRTSAARGLMVMGVLLGGCWRSHGDDACPPGRTCIVAGQGEQGIGEDGIPALETKLHLPMDVTVGPDGLLYVIDWNNHRVRVIDEEGVIHPVVGTGLLGDVEPGSPLTTGMNHPTNVIFDPSGNMLIACWHNSRLARLDKDTGQLEVIGGTGERRYRGDGGPAADAAFDLPAGIAFDHAGDLLVSDQANQVIRKVDESGIVTRFAGRCVSGDCAAGETPQACPDSDRTTCNPMDVGSCGVCRGAFAGDGGPALEARFSLPNGAGAYPAGRIAVGPEGDVYLADSENHRIRRIDTEGIVHTVAGTGVPGTAGDGGPATEAQLDRPTDVDVGPDGTLYIADTRNSCIRAVTPAGTIHTVVGICGRDGSGGSEERSSRPLLDRPYGIGVAPDGRIYIADTHNHRIRVAVPE